MQRVEFFGKNIKFLRLKNGKGQQEVADYLDVGYNTLGDYERNKTEPTFSRLIKLSELFEISIDNLLKIDIEKVQVIENYKNGQNHEKSTGKSTGNDTGNEYKTSFLEEPAPVYLAKEKDKIIADQQHIIEAQKALIDNLNQVLAGRKAK